MNLTSTPAPFLRSGRALLLALAAFASLVAGRAGAADLVQTIAAIKPSIVGIGTYMALRSPAVSFVGTGFVIGDGLSVVTNAHVVPAVIDDERKETLRVIVARGASVDYREAVLVSIDRLHDLALLKMAGPPVPAMKVGDSTTVREGQMLAFTGFPLTGILGFHPVTHRGMVSAITVVATPAPSSRSLDAKAIVQLQRNAYEVFQLDGTAYPGGSGSPLYDPETGVVLGVINKVLNATKESAITAPSGITYAIPANFIRELVEKK
ncbi:S1 family peptidase [Herbaspirillum robiniae]|uniref:Serine protease n=1 Tax=Herbaspirillum robiniae TaxID=2014887 RepID=A0A2D0B6A5_9BURK|nr:serine protease [Herbaspirillum robiniae]OWY29839.1 serine protease [Herbaspirillum robiniae]